MENKCPYCGNSLKKGKIYSLSREFGVTWFPENFKPSYPLTTSKMADNGAVQLSEYSLPSRMGAYIEVYLCSTCKKGIFDINDGLDNRKWRFLL